MAAGVGERDAGSLEGRRLGDFILGEQVGRGGQGVVHRAEQVTLGREAAVKIVPIAGRGKGEGIVRRFLREVKIAAQLDHPYAAHIYAFGAEPDLLWVAMEFVHGRPLDQVIKQDGPIPLRRFLALFERLCEVVHTAHEQGIVHRDLKPANVMVLSRAGRLLPKLLDLGIAKAVAPTDVQPFEAAPPRQDDEPPTVDLRASLDDDTPIVDPPSRIDESVPGSQGDGPEVASLASLRPSAHDPITRHGTVVGSPPYMAPEAWRTPLEVDGRVDVYALGILAYECLTGHRPFRGDLMSSLSSLHCFAEVPALGKDFSAPLDHVLRRALAKRADDRYANPSELASALRSAAAQTGSGLPRVEEALREAWLVRAPQPLAETLAVLDAATGEEQAWDALLLFRRAALHYLGVVSLAAHSQGAHDGITGSLDAAAPFAKGSPTDAEWVALIRDACRIFRDDPSRCAVPELVAFASTAGPLEALLSIGDARRRDDDESTNLPAAIEALAGVMRHLAFVADYPLGTRRGSKLEALTGWRRTPRAALHVADLDRVTDGAAVLVDRAGRLCLRLSPFVTITLAAVGMPEEVFILDGHGVRGMKQLAFPSLFERQDEEARAWFDTNLHHATREDVDAHEQRAPYLGLSTFRAEDAASFFGREREVEGFVNRLRVHPMLTVVGPSGAGKSSFVQAGVLPALSTNHTSVTVRPGRTPLATLVARLEREGVSGLSVDGLERDPTLLGQRVRMHTQMRGEQLVLVVDQLEELFTLCLDLAERQTYAAALVDLSERGGPAVRVLFTLRDDFLVAAEELPAFRARIGAGLQLLTTPQREDLVRILVEPLKARHYEFEDQALIHEMVDAVQDQPGALALLSFTARQLWEARDKHFHRLTRRSYAALGGVGGALAQHAEVTLSSLDETEQALAREAFRHLTTSRGTRATLTREEIQQLLGSGDAATSMLEKLIAARLLVAQEGEGSDRLEIIHEALLSAWPRLMRWQREDADGARLRDSLRAAARQWEDRGRPDGLLWRDDALTEYRVWRVRYPSPLTRSEEAFAAAGLRDARRGQRIRRGLAAAAFAVLVVFSASLFRANVATKRANAVARAQLATSYLDSGRQWQLRGDSARALVYLDQAQRLGASGSAFDFLVTQASLPLRAQKLKVVIPHDTFIEGDISRDGNYLAAGDVRGDATLWDARSGKKLQTLEHKAWVYSTRFSTDGEELVTAANGAQHWRWRTGEKLGEISIPEGGSFLSILPEASLALVGNNSNKAYLWNFASGKVLQTFDNGAAADTVNLSPDGTRAYTSHWGGRGNLWDAATGRLVAALPPSTSHGAFEPHGPRLVVSTNEGLLEMFGADGKLLARDTNAPKYVINGMEWSADGTFLATAGDDAMVRTWRASDLTPLRAFAGHTGPVNKVHILPDSNTLASYGNDGTIRLWDAAGGEALGFLLGHSAQVGSVAFSADASVAWSVSWDGTGRLWDWHAAVRVTPLPLDAHETVDGDLSDIITRADVAPLPSPGSFSPDGVHLVTYSTTHDASITALRDGKTCRLGTGSLPIRGLAFSPDSQLLVATEMNHPTFAVWRAKDCSLVRRFEGHKRPVRVVAFSPDGAQVASGTEGGEVVVWDVRTGAVSKAWADEPSPVSGLRFSHDGKQLYVANEFDSRDLKQSLMPDASAWDLVTGKLLWRMKDIEKESSTLIVESLSPDRIITASRNGRVCIREARTGKVLREFTVSVPANAIVLSPDGRHLLVALEGQPSVLLDATTLAQETVFEENATRSSAFSPDSKLVFLASGRVLHVYDVLSHREVATIPNVGAVVVSPKENVAVLITQHDAPRSWRFDTDPAAVAALAETVRCRLSIKMQGDELVSSSPPPDCESP